MKIGELAQQVGCLVETIRYYEKENLLPKPKRDLNNYRYYDTQHLEILTFIRRCRLLGISLEEIHMLLQARNTPNIQCDKINALIAKHLLDVQAKKEELNYLESQLTQLQHSCQTPKTIQQCGILQAIDENKLGVSFHHRKK